MKKAGTIGHRSIISLIAVTLLLGGCVTSSGADPGKVQTTEQTVELGAAGTVRAELDAKTGADLIIRDGGSSLLDTKLTYNESLKPDVSYTVSETLGMLTIVQPASQNLNSRKLDNEWDLRFGPVVPVDLTVNVTSGNTRLDVAQLRLSTLNVDTSSGSLNASIRGNQEELKSIDVSTTSGAIGLTLNGRFTSLQTLSLSESSGNISLATSGNFAALSSLQIKDTSGNTTLDLAGSWGHDLESTIRTSSGNVTIKLPSNVGVRVMTSVSSGNVAATGLHLEDGAYVNDAYGTSPVTLTFDIKVTSGNITLSLGG